MSIFACELDGKNAADDRWKLYAYSLACTCFGVDALWVVDPGGALDGFQPHDRNAEIQPIDSLEKAAEFFTSRVVIVQERHHGGMSLDDYEHPRDAMYLFGRDGGAGVHATSDCQRVWIEAAHTLYGFMAAAVVGADRDRKLRAPTYTITTSCS